MGKAPGMTFGLHGPSGAHGDNTDFEVRLTWPLLLLIDWGRLVISLSIRSAKSTW